MVIFMSFLGTFIGSNRYVLSVEPANILLATFVVDVHNGIPCVHSGSTDRKDMLAPIKVPRKHIKLPIKVPRKDEEVVLCQAHVQMISSCHLHLFG